MLGTIDFSKDGKIGYNVDGEAIKKVQQSVIKWIMEKDEEIVIHQLECASPEAIDRLYNMLGKIKDSRHSR